MLDAVFQNQKANLGDSPYERLGIGAEFHIGFSQSVEQICRLPGFSSPCEKLNCIRGALADARSAVLDNCRVEVDRGLEPKIMALILLRSSLQWPMAELLFLKDWTREPVGAFESGLNIIISLG